MKDLNNLFWLKKDINKIENQIKELTVLKSAAMSSMPSGNGVSSPVERFYERLESLQEKLSEKYRQYIDEYDRTEKFIDGIEDEEIRTIARMRYIYNFTFQQIADDLYMDKSTARKKLKRYLDKVDENDR